MLNERIVSTYSFSVRLRHLFCFCFPLRPLCPLRENESVFVFARRERKERRDLLPFVFHACAGVVANFVTTRVRREFYPLCGCCTQFPNVAMGIATLTRHRLTSRSIFQGPRSPYLVRSTNHIVSMGAIPKVMVWRVLSFIFLHQDRFACCGHSSGIRRTLSPHLVPSVRLRGADGMPGT